MQHVSTIPNITHIDIMSRGTQDNDRLYYTTKTQVKYMDMVTSKHYTVSTGYEDLSGITVYWDDSETDDKDADTNTQPMIYVADKKKECNFLGQF